MDQLINGLVKEVETLCRRVKLFSADALPTGLEECQLDYGRRDRRGSILTHKGVHVTSHVVFWLSTNATHLHRIAQNLATAPHTNTMFVQVFETFSALNDF